MKENLISFHKFVSMVPSISKWENSTEQGDNVNVMLIHYNLTNITILIKFIINLIKQVIYNKYQSCNSHIIKCLEYLKWQSIHIMINLIQL